MYEIHNARELNSASKIELDNLRLRDKKYKSGRPTNLRASWQFLYSNLEIL